MRTATTSAIPSIDHRERAARASVATRFAGIAIASLAPAVFWCLVIDIAFRWAGHPLAARTTLLVGFAIAAFLCVICAPLMLRGLSSATEPEEAEIPPSGLTLPERSAPRADLSI